MATLKNQMDSLLSPEDMMLQGLEEGTVEQAAEDLKSVGKGALFSPITGAADVVETGKMLPELDERAKPFAPVYSSVEGAFEELSKLGFTRENAVKAIKDITGVELKSDSAEMAGELIGLPAVAATKAASAVAKAATKYGSEAPKAVSRIYTEAKKIFTDTGGFDDMATATAGSSAAQTSKMLSKKDLPDTSVTKIIIGQSGKDYEQKADSYRRAKQAWIPGKNRVNDQDAQELWNRTGAQEDVIDGDIVYEVPTVNAKLKTQDSDLFDYDKGTVSFTGGKDRDTPVRLSEILDFDELYEQAPYLRDVEVRRISGFARLLGTRAAYNPTENVIYIASGSSKKLTSNLLHEVEHAVQAADGKTYAGGNFRRIMNQDPEYKKLGGAERQNKLNKDAENLINKYSGPSDSDEYFTRRGEVRGMLEILAKTPNPSKFVQAVTKLPEIEGANRGGGTFKYLSDISNYMEKNFPTINLQYSSLIDDAMTFIRNTDQKTIDALIKDYKKAGLSDLQKFEKIKEKAILKYMRDPGEVTARNVQFRYLTSQQDPSITNVVPRATEDRYISSKEIPFDNKPPTKTAEQLTEEGQRMDVPLTEEGYYTSTAAERGDAAESLVEQTSEVFAKPLDIGVSEFAQSGKLLKNYDSSTLQEINAKSKFASAGNARADKLIDADVAEGTKVGVRLNLNSKIEDMPAGLNKLQTVHKGNYNGQALSYRPYVTVKNAVFNVNQKGRAAVAAKIKGSQSEAAKNKYNLASVDGNITSVENVFDSVDGDVVEIGFNPASTHLFIDLSTGQAVKNAEIATVVGDRVYAKGVTYLKKAEAPEAKNPEIFTFEDGTEIPSEVRYKMKKGGAVPMNTMAKQMELFEPVQRGFNEGGLMDEGGMVDEMSGNEVPPGSLREEVRDDIPAQLSEGEFVFPADVVRYFGLEKLMKMRQEAKAGLARMEAMGQMGNSDEATLPDDIPFDVEDLEIENEEDDLEFQVGGYVPGMSQRPMMKPQPYSPYGQQPPSVYRPQYYSAQPSLTYTSDTSNLPTFQQTIGPGVPYVDFEYVEYVNDAGQTVRLRRSKTTGKLLDPVPAGFRPKSEKVTTQTTQVSKPIQDDGGGDRDTTDPGGTTDVTGVGYDRSKVNTALSDVISKYGAGFGTLSDTFLKGPAQSFSKIPGITNLFGGIKMESTALANAATSAAFGGVLDNIRGVVGGALDYGISRTGAPNRQYTDTTPLDQMDERNQGVIAGIANVVMPEVQSLFQDSEGNAIESSKALSNVKAELSRLGLSPREIDKLSKKGGNFNQLEKLTRALGNLKVQEIQETTNPALIDRVSKAVVAASEKAKAAEAAGNVARGSGPQVADTVTRDYYSDFMSGRDDNNNDNGNDNSVGPGEGGSGIGADDTGSTGFGTGTDCLTEDMKVKLNGVVDFVTNVKVGDIIDNYRVKEVLHKHMREGYYSINNELKISNDHPVLANGTWTRPEDLVVGDSINGIPVSSLEYVEQLTPTVSIVIDGESFDVHTENNIYTVHGRYKEIRQQAA